MDFEFKEEHKLLVKMVRDFAENELKPFAPELDAKEVFPADTLREMARLGLMAMTIPEDLGGSGMDTVSFVLSIMEMASAYASTAATMSVTNMLAEAIFKFGSNERKERNVLPIVIW